MKSLTEFLTAATLFVAMTISAAAASAGQFDAGLVSAVEVTATATVVSVDLETREVTLKDEDGEEFSFIAGDEVRNLPQVQAGDLVTVTYMEALAYEIRRGGEMDVSEALALARAEIGEMPGGIAAYEAVVSVEVIAIDYDTPTVTFRGPMGDTRTILVRHPERLEGVSIGDIVDLIFQEALAISVERVE